jgi:hypothetical protein
MNNNPKKLKTGDLVYCYTDRDDSGCMPFKQTYFKTHKYYEIVEDNNQLYVMNENNWLSDFYVWQDYFLTMNELREQKLKRLIND